MRFMVHVWCRQLSRDVSLGFAHEGSQNREGDAPLLSLCGLFSEKLCRSTGYLCNLCMSMVAPSALHFSATIS
jgi:hypothetical protein